MLKHKTLFIVMGWLCMAWVAMPGTALAAEDADEIQSDISSIEKKLKKAEEKKASLQAEVNALSSSLSKTERTIAETRIKIQQAENAIERKAAEVELLEAQIEEERTLLSELLRDLYYDGSVELPELLLSEDAFTSLINQPDRLLSVKDRIDAILQSLESRHVATAAEKGELEEAKADHQELLAAKANEKRELAADRAEVLDDVADQEKIISRLNKELKELQGDLSKILGKSYNAADIKEAVSFASGKTGVPKGFLFGVLKMETNLGANVGGCTYAEVEDGAEKNYKAKKLGKRAWSTFQYRRDIFKKITDELGLDYRKQKVSCNPRGYVGTGGAMGVAQFMPDTWMGYKAEVASITGHRPPSPWNLTDGVMAMALKLDRVPGVDDGDRGAWKRAAAAYLGTSYAPYINGILYWADNYKKLI